MTDSAERPTEDPIIANEKALLGAAIRTVDLTLAAFELVRPGDMTRPAHGMIFEAALDLAGKGEPVNPTAVMTELSKRGELNRVGAGPYLFELVEHGCLPGEINYHATQIRKRVETSNLRILGERYKQIADNDAYDLGETIDVARTMFDSMFADVAQDGAVEAADIVSEVLDSIESKDDSDTLKTGFTDLDKVVTIRPGQLIVIAARPGVGKSTVALDIARDVAIRRREPVLLVSIEMGRNEVVERMLAAEGKVNLKRIQDRAVTDDNDWKRLGEAHSRILEGRLVIHDSPGTGLAQIRARLRQMASRGGVKLAVVDYIGIVKSAGRTENRQQAVAEISRGLKLIAREFKIPVIALAQTNRNPELRQDKRPTMADLRESGAIEADADIVIMLHRPDMHDPEDPRAGEVDLIIDKQRQGPRGVVALAWQGHYGRAIDLGRDDPPPASRGHLKAVQ